MTGLTLGLGVGGGGREGDPGAAVGSVVARCCGVGHLDCCAEGIRRFRIGAFPYPWLLARALVSGFQLGRSGTCFLFSVEEGNHANFVLDELFLCKEKVYFSSFKKKCIFHPSNIA